MATPIPPEIQSELEKCFETNDPDDDSLARIIYFIGVQAANEVAERFIQSLKSVLHMPVVFKQVAKRMAEDTKTAEEDPKFMQCMIDVWSNFMKWNPDEMPGHGQRWALDVPKEDVSAVVQHNFMRAVAKMTPARYRALTNVVKKIGESSAVVRYAGKALAKARIAQPLVRVALVVGFLAYDVIVNIRRWWKGEISGERCVKNIMDNGVAIAAGIAGGIGGEMVGGAIGSVFGPVGAAFGVIAGGIVGGIGASFTAHSLSDRLTQWMFGLPKSEALEKAYNF